MCSSHCGFLMRSVTFCPLNSSLSVFQDLLICTLCTVRLCELVWVVTCLEIENQSCSTLATFHCMGSLLLVNIVCVGHKIIAKLTLESHRFYNQWCMAHGVNSCYIAQWCSAIARHACITHLPAKKRLCNFLASYNMFVYVCLLVQGGRGEDGNKDDREKEQQWTDVTFSFTAEPIIAPVCNNFF